MYLRTGIGVALALMTLTACKRAAHFIERGNEAVKSGKLADAEINYKNAIQKEPSNFEAHLRLAITARRRGNAKLAFDTISRAIELNSKDAEAWALYGNICWDGYMADPRRPKTLYLQVVRSAERLLELNPSSVDGLRLKGLLAMADKKPAQAAGFFRKAVQLRPEDPELVLAQAQSLLLVGDDMEAIRLITAVIKSRKDYFPAYDTMYGYFMELRRPADAEKVLLLKAGNNPAESAFALQLAEHYSRTGNRAARDRALERLTGNLRQFADAWLRVGNFHSGRGDWPQAEQAYREGLRAQPAEALVYKRRIASCLTALGKGQEAQSMLDELIRDRPDDRELLSQRGSLRMALGDTRGATADLRHVVEKHPAEADSRNLLARAYERQGDFESARAEYAAVLASQPSQPQALLGSAEVFTKQLRFSEAIGFVEKYLEIRPSDHRALLLRAVAHLGSQNIPAAIADLRKMLSANPNDREAALQLGLIFTSQGRFTEAEALFARFVNPRDKDTRPTLGLARIRAAQGRFDDALTLLRNRLPLVADPKSVRREIIKVALQGGKKEMAIHELLLLVNETPADPDVLLQLGQLYLDTRETGKALDFLSRARQAAPNRPEPVALKALALNQAGRTREADAEYRAALQLAPDDPALHNNFGFFLAESGASLDEALVYAQKAVKSRPDVPQFSDTVAWILLKKNEPNKAIQTLRILVRDHPDVPQFRHHLGLALIQTGDHAGGRTELMAALKGKPSPAEVSQIRQVLDALPR